MSRIEQKSKLLEENGVDRILKEDGGFLLLEDGLYVRDDFTRGDQANWGTATPDLLYTWGTDADSSIVSNRGRASNAAGSDVSVVIGSTYADFDAKVMIRVSDIVSWDAEIRGRYDGVGSWVRGGTSSTGGVFIQQKVNSGGTTTLANNVSKGALTANVDYWLRFQAEGNTVRLKRWRADTEGEPETWDTTATTVILTSGKIGLDAFWAAGSITIEFSNFFAGRIGSNDDNPAITNRMQSLLAQ